MTCGWKKFTDIHEAVDAYRRGEATIDDISIAASRVITADLRRRSVIANARLIAAAPELLAVAMALVDDCGYPHCTDSLHVAARTAIARAVGDD